MSEELTSVQWDLADAIARTLVREGVKVNELQKAIAYLRTYSTTEAGKFFTYLQVLAKEGQRVGHSKQTQSYYETLNRTCRQYLQGMDVATMLLLLGWSVRLLRYYSDGGFVGEIAEPIVRSQREAEISAIVAEMEFAIGQVVVARVSAKKGNKLTIEFAKGLLSTQKEPKWSERLEEGDCIRVEVLEVYEDGRIKKCKILEQTECE